MRIMYVEDNMVNLSLVQRIAQMGSHDVVSYSNGTQALEALESDRADLILMDIELEGELDGIEVVKRLRKRGDKRPIIAITAYAMVGDKERILEAGCDDYLPKPLPISQFVGLLAKYDPANVQPESKSEEIEFLGGKQVSAGEEKTTDTTTTTATNTQKEPSTSGQSPDRPQVQADEAPAGKDSKPKATATSVSKSKAEDPEPVAATQSTLADSSDNSTADPSTVKEEATVTSPVGAGTGSSPSPELAEKKAEKQDG